jgi:hypothetical protein
MGHFTVQCSLKKISDEHDKQTTETGFMSFAYSL